MPKLKLGTIIPTPEENAAINAGIAADPDTFELDDEWFARAKPAIEVDADLVENSARRQDESGKPTPRSMSPSRSIPTSWLGYVRVAPAGRTSSTRHCAELSSERDVAAANFRC